MKKVAILFIIVTIITGCTNSDNPKQQKEYSNGIPVVVYNEIRGWHKCATPYFLYNSSLEHKVKLRPKSNFTLPKWGIPFEFKANYKYVPAEDANLDYYEISDLNLKSTYPSSKCFELIFRKPDTGKICEPKNIVADLKKWFSPNQIFIKDSKLIENAANNLPMVLVGCFENENLDITINLKK